MKRSGVLATLFIAVAVALPVAARAASGPVTLTLIAQTQVVDPAGQFDMHLQMLGIPPGDAEIDITAYTAATDRDGLREAFAGRLGTTINSKPLRFPISRFLRDPTGGFDLAVALSPSSTNDPNALVLTSEGVYPVAVTLRDRFGSTIDHFVTAIIRGTGGAPSHPLSTAFLLPITSDVTYGADLKQRPLTDAPQSLNDYSDVLAARSSPVTVIPAPDLLEVLTATEDGQVALLRLDRALTAHQVLATTYVPVDAAVLVASNLGSEIGTQLVAGEAAARRSLAVARPDRRSWLAGSSIDRQTLTQLQTLGVNQVVVPNDALTSSPSDAGTLRTVEIETNNGTVSAAVIDQNLSRDLVAGTPTPLAAQLVSAELSLSALAAPDLEQGTVIVPPAGGITPSRLNAILEVLEANQLLKPTTLDDYFKGTGAAAGADGQPIVRSLLAPRAPSLGAAGARLQSGRLQAQSVEAMVPGDQVLRAQLDKLLLLAARSGLSDAERSPYFDAVQQLTAGVTTAVRITDQGTVTLTSTTDEVPYIITNITSTPVNVSLHLSSTKLEFPGSPSKGVLDLTNITLSPGTTQRTVRVKALARATFPLTIQVLTPDGRQLLASAELKVRSTALSGVGIALTIGAGAILVLWWVRQIVRRRRDRRAAARGAHPAGQGPASSLAQP